MAVSELLTFSDESGIDGQARFCFVMGFIGSPRQWHSLNAKWRETLDGEGLCEFKASEFFDRRRWRSSKNPYRGWTPERATAFLEALLRIIHTHGIKIVGGGVDAKAFQKLPHADRRFATGAVLAYSAGRSGVSRKLTTTGAPSRPYFGAFILLLEEALALTPDGVKVHFTFDEQNVYEGYARQLFSVIKNKGLMRNRGGEKLGDITYAWSEEPGKEGLQVADMYVYVMRANQELKIGLGRSKWSKDLKLANKSLRRKRSWVRVLNEDSFQKMAENLSDESLLKELLAR